MELTIKLVIKGEEKELTIEEAKTLKKLLNEALKDDEPKNPYPYDGYGYPIIYNPATGTRTMTFNTGTSITPDYITNNILNE